MMAKKKKMIALLFSNSIALPVLGGSTNIVKLVHSKIEYSLKFTRWLVSEVSQTLH